MDARFAAHESERREWLDATAAALQRHESVQGLILYGSLARNTADAWSDVDLVVLVDPGALHALVAGRESLVASFGDPLYVLDSPWNAPLEGAQVNVLYRMRSGLPLYVDWNLWPASMAAQPHDTAVLFTRPGTTVPIADETFQEWATFERQRRPSPSELGADGVRHARFGMLPIAAKYCARRDTERLRRLVVGIGASELPAAPREQLSLLRELLGALASGESPEAVSAVDALLDAAGHTLEVTNDGGEQRQ